MNLLLTEKKMVRNEILHDQCTKHKDTILYIYGFLSEFMICTEYNIILTNCLLDHLYTLQQENFPGNPEDLMLWEWMKLL